MPGGEEITEEQKWDLTFSIPNLKNLKTARNNSEKSLDFGIKQARKTLVFDPKNTQVVLDFGRKTPKDRCFLKFPNL